MAINTKRSDIDYSNVAAEALDIAKKVEIMIKTYSLKVRQSSFLAAIPADNALGFLRKYCTNDDKSEGEIINFIKHLAEQKLGASVFLLVSSPRPKDHIVASGHVNNLSTHHDRYHEIRLSSDSEICPITKSDVVLVEAGGKRFAGTPLRGRVIIPNCEAVPCADYKEMYAAATDIVVSMFKYKGPVLQPFDQQATQKLQLTISKNVSKAVGVVAGRIWQDFYKADLHGGKGSGPKFANLFYSNINDSGAAGILTTYCEARALPDTQVFKVQYARNKYYLMPRVMHPFMMCELPDRCKVALDDTGALQLSGLSLKAMGTFLYLSRMLRGRDYKRYSGMTLGYFYGIMYLNSAMVESANWYNIMYFNDISRFSVIIVSTRKASSLQGICAALRDMDSTAELVVAGFKGKKTDFCYSNIRFYANNLYQLMTSTVMNERGARVRRYDPNSLLLIDTNMESIYDSYAKETAEFASKRDDINSTLGAMDEEVASISLFPMIDEMLQVVKDKKFSFGLTPEPHTGYVLVYNKISPIENAPPYWVRQKDFSVAKTICVLVNILRNSVSVKMDFQPYLLANKLPAFSFCNTIPIKHGQPRRVGTVGHELNFESIIDKEGHFKMDEMMKAAAEKLSEINPLYEELPDSDNDSEHEEDLDEETQLVDNRPSAPQPVSRFVVKKTLVDNDVPPTEYRSDDEL